MVMSFGNLQETAKPLMTDYQKHIPPATPHVAGEMIVPRTQVTSSLALFPFLISTFLLAIGKVGFLSNSFVSCDQKLAAMTIRTTVLTQTGRTNTITTFITHVPSPVIWELLTTAHTRNVISHSILFLCYITSYCSISKPYSANRLSTAA